MMSCIKKYFVTNTTDFLFVLVKHFDDSIEKEMEIVHQILSNVLSYYQTADHAFEPTTCL